MTRIALYGLVCAVLTLVACVKKDESTMLRSANEAAQHGKWEEAVSGYGDILKEYPNSAHGAEALFKIGIIQTNQLKDYTAGMKTLEDVANRYASSDEAPKALMTLGFLYANQPDVKKLDLAKKYYEQVVSRYPSNELAASANIELENLGQSPENALQHAQESKAPVFSHDSVVHAPSAQALAH